QLAASGLSGLSFYPVHKRHIVALRWEQWDPAAEAPPEYPASGEPEDFVWERPHDPELAAQLGLIWEVRLQPHAVVRRVQEGEHSWEVAIFVEEASWDGTDLFQAEGVGYRFASERAKQWLDAMVPAWVSFTPVGDGQRVNPALF
ncbi:MAG: hypothetical protein QOF51_1982, partial [Chloroflexota bacterium]|nr:hypothetical protein [Chloroflexota bacterium]